MDCSFGFLTNMLTWGSPSQAQCCEPHLSIVRDYFNLLSTACDFRPELPSADLFDLFRYGSPHNTRHVFTVPKLTKFHRTKHITKSQLLEAFLSFLLRLLYHKKDPKDNLCHDRIYDLEKELRFLLTILGHASLLLCDDERDSKPVRKLLEEFEEVANEAGGLVRLLLFSADQDAGEMQNGAAAVLRRIEGLNDRFMEFLNPAVPSSNSRRDSAIPKTSVVDSFVFVKTLTYFLEDLMEGADNRIDDLVYLIRILKQGLPDLKDLDSLRPSEIGELKEAVMQIGDLAYEAEYLIISFLVGDAPFWYVINRLSKASHKIELIGTELRELTKKYESGGLLKTPKYTSTQRSFQAKRDLEVDGVVVGFEERANYILELLAGGTEQSLQVISIFGMAGAGKTTLANKLYRHPCVNDRFDVQSWCIVSQTYQKERILKEIWTDLTSKLGKGNIKDEEGIDVRIYKTLVGRRYLIVLDDTWDPNVWDDLKRCFPNNGNGSRILFTTRNKDVAPSISFNYELPSLSNDQCWELLEKKVFGDEHCPVELKGIGMKIAANCGGLPLVVVVIAGILSTMDKERETWEEVCANLASHIFDGGDNSVMQILELSYKHLPEHLKPCFLYTGAVQEGKEIPVGTLLRLWISEGFIHKEEGQSAENIAEKYLLELIDKSLVIVSRKRSDGGVKACALHDLLRDLCLKKSEEENFFKFVNTDTVLMYERGHRIQAPRHQVVSMISSQHTRSLHGRITSVYARDMRSLRVLNCDSHCLSGIEYLANLRYLVISNLPPNIDSLMSLEYLNLSDFKVIYLPPEIMKLKKLRHIQSPVGVKYEEKCSSSETSNLEHLYRVWITELKDEQMLRCSLHLRKLKCRYRPFPSPDNNGAARYADLSFLTQLDSLKIGPSGAGEIREIRFPSNITKLTLIRHPRDTFVVDSEMMSSIGSLERLEVLKLRSVSFEGKRWETGEGGFRKLRYLKVCEVGELEEWEVETNEHFPRLQHLVLKDCKNLKEIPCEIGEISTLEMIEVQGRCRRSLVESAKEIQQLQLDNGNETLRINISVRR